MKATLVLLCMLGCKTKSEPTAQTTVIAANVPAANVPATQTKCPGWTDLRACKADGFVYASGKMHSGRMADQVAANRARTALFGDKQGDLTVDQSELPAVTTCGDDVVVLARAPVGNLKADVAACEKPVDLAVNAPGCTEWTQKRTYRQGNTLYAVVPIDSTMQNVAMAQTTAENRARAAAVQYVHFAVNKNGDSVSVSNAGTAPPQQGGVEKAECNGTTYIRLAFSAN